MERVVSKYSLGQEQQPRMTSTSGHREKIKPGSHVVKLLFERTAIFLLDTSYEESGAREELTTTKTPSMTMETTKSKQVAVDRRQWHMQRPICLLL